ncbi:hypothetical protein VE04_02732 [Pseudogymnoascus sp. 24MN13]|nr:hypothetical protein VE04_02732 [Pseudogymnoascus sp. 24MN13]
MAANTNSTEKGVDVVARHDEESADSEFPQEKPSSSQGSEVETVDHPRLKSIKRKVDLRICLVLGCLYTISLLDRVNLPVSLSVALDNLLMRTSILLYGIPALTIFETDRLDRVVAGMAKDLKLVGNQYSLLVLVFFPFYISFQPPMTVIAKKLGPRNFLTGIVVSWGLVMVGHGLVPNWKVMLALRCLLGLFEAGFFSTCVYLLSTWYVRREVAKRNAAFYLLGSFFAGFGGILAYGVSKMDGIAGREGWRWIFIIEGVLTVAMGLIAFFFLVDFPEKAMNSWRFLNEDDLKIIVDRVERDRSDVVAPPFKLGEYLKNGLDWKVYFFAANFGLSSVVTYAAAYFLPIVLRDGLHFSVAAAQCLSTPCYVFASILGYSQGYWSDKINMRTPFILFNCLLEIIGVAVLGFATQNPARYFGAFLIIGGANSNIALVLTYQANNIVGQWRRAFCSATIVGAGGMGGIIGSLTFRSQDAPDYRPGLYTCLVAAIMVALSVTTTTTHFYFKNKKQAQGLIVLEGLPGFRYTY